MSKILIVEDEEAIADLEKDYLELSGFEVEIENRGDTGLDKALNEDYDLLILDLMLPEVDGFEICRQVREKKNMRSSWCRQRRMISTKSAGSDLEPTIILPSRFLPARWVARVKAHLARYDRLIGSGQKTNDVIEIRGIKIDKTAAESG